MTAGAGDLHRTLEAREEQLRFLSEHLADGMVYQIDSGPDGRERRFSYLSPAVERLHGLRVEDALRDPGLIYGQVVEEDRGQLARAEAEAFAARRLLDVEVRVRLPAGEVRRRRFISAPATDAAGSVLWSGIELDVTERRAMEEAVRGVEQDRREIRRLQAQIERTQTLESVGRLAGGVAHDFNNMLGVIIGRAELALLEAGLPAAAREGLEEILGAARRSADLTRQLLAFARRQAAAPRVLDLNEAVAGTLKMLRRLIGEDVDLAWMPGAALGRVRVDPSQVDQVLANLCVNARDAIAGVGRITIRTENATLDEAACAALDGCRPGPHVLLRVSDTGHGMPPEVLEHVFEPFFTTKGVGQGTGLGLATVYGIVRQNEGQIAVESAPGEGTTFSIYLPRVEAAVDGAAAPEEAVPPGRGETVLLVEDEPAILRMGRAMLEGLGYRVLAAATPEEALREAAAHAGPIDLLLADVVMPGMNGRDLADRLAAARPGLPCLFVSGHPVDVISRQGVLDPRVRLLPKPFTRSGLAAAVRAALGGERTPRPAAPRD